MSNWFERHPLVSVVSHTIIVGGGTWAWAYFGLYQDKLELHQAKIATLETILEQERINNSKYLSWLLDEPNSIPFLENKIKSLEEKLQNISERPPEFGDKDAPNVKINIPYESTKQFLRGESFVDPKTGATIGISEISSDYRASGRIFLPGESNSRSVTRASPGDVWFFTHDDVKYKLTLEGVNWLNNSLQASVSETDEKK